MRHRLSLPSFAAWLALLAQATAQQPHTTEAKPEIDAAHAEKMQAGLALFKSDVREVLIKHCIDCHGGDEVQSGLDLATRKGLLRGGAHGLHAAHELGIDMGRGFGGAKREEPGDDSAPWLVRFPGA